MIVETQIDNIRDNLKFLEQNKSFAISNPSYLRDVRFLLTKVSQLEAKCHQQQLEICEMRNELARSVL